jgi:hypothetical protein
MPATVIMPTIKRKMNDHDCNSAHIARAKDNPRPPPPMIRAATCDGETLYQPASMSCCCNCVRWLSEKTRPSTSERLVVLGSHLSPSSSSSRLLTSLRCGTSDSEKRKTEAMNKIVMIIISIDASDVERQNACKGHGGEKLENDDDA